MDLKHWLDSKGLGKFAELFAANDIDFDLLPQLTEHDLDKLGLSVGAQRRLAIAVQSLDSNDSSPDVERSPEFTLGERRQLTVLFCDMVGFTELASRVDPEILQNIIRVYEDACAAAVTRYEGYVFQRLGDGIVAFFGYPLAHEGEAERAIRAGLDIVDAFAKLDVPDAGQLHVRIGIATGLVVVASAEKGAVGETMNLASRLQNIAKVDTIVVSERVQRLAGGSFDYEDLGEHTLKGIARPTHAFQIVGISGAESRFAAAHAEQVSQLVGRTHELGLLMERWQLARQGEGQVVLLSGEPGIGKSRILSALRERLTNEHYQFLGSQCSPFHSNTAFYPIAEQLSRLAQFDRNDSNDVKLDKLESFVSGMALSPAAVMPLFAAALSLPSDGRYPPLNISPLKQKDRTVAALSEQVLSMSRDRPVLFFVEDMHWGDPTSLEVVGSIIDGVGESRVLVVCTYRPEFNAPWGAFGHVTSLNLSKLTRAQSEAVVKSVTGGRTMPAGLVEQVLDKTDGVPLFVEELTRSILESGELTESGDRLEYTGTSVTIPETLRDSLMARLDRYAPMKEIAQIGAAIGREFSYELISAVAPGTPLQLDDALAQLTDSGLAFRRGTPPEASYEFKHALVQDVAYDSLLKSRRQELHALLAHTIEERFPDMRESDPDLLARHCEGANRIEDAISYRLRAGEQARASFAYAEARAQFDEGLDLLNRLPSSEATSRIELDLLSALGPVLMATEGQASESVRRVYDRAREVCAKVGSANQMFGVTFNLWTTKLLGGELPMGRELSAEMLSSGAALQDPGLMVQAQHTCWSTQIFSGNFREAILATEEGRRLYDPVRDVNHKFLFGGHDPHCCAGTFAAVVKWYMGYPDTAARLRDESLEEMRQIGHPFTSALMGAVIMQTYFLENDVDRLREAARKVRQISERDGFPATFSWADAYIGWTMARDGNEEGLELISNAIESLKSMRLRTQFSFYLGLQADALWACDKRRAALDSIDAGLAVASNNDEQYFAPELHRMKGEMLLAEDREREDEAQGCFLKAIEISKRCEGKSLELRSATALARLWQSQGKHQEASALLAPVYNWFTEGFNTRDLKEAKALLQELPV
jgi:class 3 adenylate cyclase/predicted ATPase